MTNDEGTWSWWQIMWATEGASFNRHTGTASHATDAPTEYSNLKQNTYGDPLGGINHQNTCGHGFSWRESFRFVETHEHGHKGRMLPPAKAKEGGTGNRTLMGASPSEIRFRDYSDRQKRWSNK